MAPRDKEAVIILGSGPNRIGQGIEFDYSCVHASLALVRPGRGRLRDDHGQLQPGDGLDRLRHLRPAVLRAADAGGRARDRARRAGRRPGRRRDLPARRADAARPGPGARGRRGADRGHVAGGDPPGRGAGRVRPGAGRGRADRAQARDGDLVRRGAGASRPRSATRCWCARPTCSAGAAWRSSTTTTRWRRYIERGHRDQPGPPGAGRPVHRRRGRDRRRRDLRRQGPVPRRRDGAHRGGRHPLRRLVVRAAADHAGRGGDRADPRGHRGDRARASGCAGCSTSSTRWAPTCSTCSRPTRGPAARCRSCPRRPRRRWPRRPRG